MKYKLLSLLLAALLTVNLTMPGGYVVTSVEAQMPVRVPLPALSFRPDSLLLIYVDFDACIVKGMTEGQRSMAFAEACRCCTPLTYVGLTTDLPRDRLSGTYMTCRVLPRNQVPNRLSAGGWTEKNLYLQTDLYGTNTSYVLWGDPEVNGRDVSGNLIVNSPKYVGKTIAHEAAGHGFQPPSVPGHTSGLFDPYASGDNFDAFTIMNWNAYAPTLATGQRFGMFIDQAGVYRNDWHEKRLLDPNWPLPVIFPGYLIFTRGEVPPCLTLPPGFKSMKVADPSADGKLVVDFNSGTLYHPGPVGGAPTLGKDLTFGPGKTSEPEWGATRSGPLHGWVIRRDTKALWIEVAQQMVHVP